jgi:hypothetical protein
MMICNPDEPATNANPNFPFNPAGKIGTQIIMRSGGGGGAAWAPGEFGWIDAPDNAGSAKCAQGGHQDLGCVLGLVNPLTQCVNDSQIQVSTGQQNPTADGLNVRFDLYPGNPNNKRLGPATNVNTDLDFAPSANITKALCAVSGGACDYSNNNARCANPANGLTQSSAITKTVKLPRDSQWCTAAGNCVATPDATHRFGNGSWDRAGYWTANHGGTLPPALTNATRYQVYRYEIDNAATGTLPNYSSLGGENGDHRLGGTGNYCSNQAGINNAAKDRRVLYLAVVNCHCPDATCTPLSGASVNNRGGVRVVAYVKVFLTEPVGFDFAGAWNNAREVYGEIVDVIKPNDASSIVHVYPVLYR